MDEETALWKGMTGPRMERCLLGKEEINLPEIFMEQPDVFLAVLSQETWDRVLTAKQKTHLKKFLPTFPNDDEEEKEKTLKGLFALDNFKFGNPLKQFQIKMRDGYFSPDIAKYASLCRRVKFREYKFQQQRYYSDLLKDILLSRQNVFEQARHLPPVQPIKFNYKPPIPQQNKTIEQRVKKKYIRLLKEMREEIGVIDTSSDEEEESISPVQRSRRQLFKSLGPIPSPDPTIPSVLATFASKPVLVNGDAPGETPQQKRQRPFSPVEITDENYKQMLKSHKRKKIEQAELPELDTTNITLQDILQRCQANKKNSKSPSGNPNSQNGGTVKKKIKMKDEKKLKKKIKKETSDKPTEEVIDAVSPPLHSRTENIEVSDEILNPHVDAVPDFPLPDNSMSNTKLENGKADNFFVLIRDIMCEFPDMKCTLPKLEEKMREWQESTSSSLNAWFKQHTNWPDCVLSALKFLSGDALGYGVDNFIPYVDYKERPQHWKWIGVGRDSPDKLLPLYNYWLQNKDGHMFDGFEANQSTPPPARSKTDYVVKATTEEEKDKFREQEEQRFYEPHKPYTYSVHGYESVVGPVKGVYSKDSAMTKAREHALLISDRPAYVTILTIVRDAAARLPNGEGTRADICEILKDSQFLATGVTDAQINTVVSGALDRLHSEKDPCVKYDVNKKIWIYLHRNRSEQEFERIHQAQLAAAKAKKSLQKPKASKASKESANSTTSPRGNNTTTPSTTTASEINIEDLVAQAHAQAVSSSQSHQSPKRSTTIANQLKSQKGSPRGGAQKQTSVKLNVAAQLVSTTPGLTIVTASQGLQTAAQLLQSATPTTGISRPAVATPNKEMMFTHAQALKMLQEGSLTAVTNPQTSKQEIFLQRQVSAPPSSLAAQGVSATAKLMALSHGSSVGTTTVSSQPSSAPVTTENPVMARVVQHMSGAQMVSVGNILAAGQPRIPGAQVPRTTTIKIQGGSIVHPVGGGKPFQLTGTPIANNKGLVQIGGKGHPLGLIQTPQGTIISIPQMVTSGIMTFSQPKSLVAVAGSKPTTAVSLPTTVTSSQARTPATSTTNVGQTLQVVNSQPKVVTPSQAGIVVTQLAPGSISLRHGLHGISQNKVIPGQGGLVPTQFILQQSPGGGIKAPTTTDSTSTTQGTPIIVSNTAGKGGQNLQVVRTVLSSQGQIRPGQATILISQPTLQQPGSNVLQAGQIMQANTKTPGRGSPKGKAQPVYARIITPPPGITLKAMAQGQTGTPLGVSMIQTMGKIMTSTAPQTVTSVAVSQTQSATVVPSDATSPSRTVGAAPRQGQ
ncbi:hypothetical protein SNE40_016863 [Patella caerulea]|uniref:DEUBAD domain-containing protein n=1 Tax=Patella caerulea TaxID=87958 RepID=A0AAN8JE17_PATCE